MSKRLLTLSFRFIAAAFLFFVFSSVGFGGTSTFQRSFGLGARGGDVLILQKLLNADAETAVALSGPGSLGLETDAFGPMTRSAVVKFQKKYAADVLAYGQSPTGYVGPRTLRKLNALGVWRSMSGQPVRLRQNEIQSSGQPAASSQPSAKETESRTTSRVPASALSGNPNLVNLDKFLSALETVGRKQGLDDERLRVLSAAVKEESATTTNFRQKFKEILSKQKQTARIPPLAPRPLALGVFFKRLVSFFDFSPAVAEAQVGAPFGGAVFYVFFCPCSGNWLLEVEPLPPTFATLLSYYEGSQAFASYNAPFSPELLGFYEPGAGVCLIPIAVGCAGLPTEGLITSFLGSALI